MVFYFACLLRFATFAVVGHNALMPVLIFVFRRPDRLFPTARQFSPAAPASDRLRSSGQRVWYSQSIAHEPQSPRFQFAFPVDAHADRRSCRSERPAAVQVSEFTERRVSEEPRDRRPDNATAAAEKSGSGSARGFVICIQFEWVNDGTLWWFVWRLHFSSPDTIAKIKTEQQAATATAKSNIPTQVQPVPRCDESTGRTGIRICRLLCVHFINGLSWQTPRYPTPIQRPVNFPLSSLQNNSGPGNQKHRSNNSSSNKAPSRQYYLNQGKQFRLSSYGTQKCVSFITSHSL